jgi:hypothetical protein
MPDRPIPLLGAISLEFVQRIEHSIDAGFVSTPIAGLPGELQQRSNRMSHRIALEGVLFGASAADNLKSLQEAAGNGEELTFSADITTALDLQKVLITRLDAIETAGNPSRFDYRLQLAESPPLPPPAQVSGFGGLDDFGLGDLGFDTDILGDITDIAGDIAGAVNDALQVIDAVTALADLGGLELGNFLAPIGEVGDRVASVGTNFRNAFDSLSGAFS